jgi:hypothetical protein
VGGEARGIGIFYKKLKYPFHFNGLFLRCIAATPSRLPAASVPALC